MPGRARLPIIALLVVPPLVASILLASSASRPTARAATVADRSRSAETPPASDTPLPIPDLGTGPSVAVTTIPLANHQRNPADLQKAGPGPGDGGAADRVARDRLVIPPPYLGVSTYPNSPAIATRFGLPHRPGVVVVQVDPNGPAARAGVKVNDVITAVNGRPVTDASTLYEDLAQQRPGSTDVLVIARGNQTVSVTVTFSSASPIGG